MTSNNMFSIKEKIQIMRKYEPDPQGTYMEYKSHKYRSRIKVFLVITAAVSLTVYLFTL